MKDYSNYRNYLNVDMRKYSGEILFKEHLKQEGMYVKINGNENTIIGNNEVPYFLIVRNYGIEHKEGLEERLLIFGKEFNIKTGDYIDYLDEKYIINSHVDKDNPFRDSCKIILCNQTIHWKDSLGEHTYPCYSTNSAYGSKITATNDYVPEVDTKDKIYVQYNEITKNIDFGYRFMFNHSKKDIFKVTDFDSGNMTGLIILTCEKDSYLPEDDLENNLCHIENVSKDTPTNPTTYNIIGEDEIKQNIEYTYSLDNGNCTWEIDEESLNVDIAEIISFDDNSCIIKASKQRTDEYFTLIVKDNNGNILTQKEIKSLVVR